MTTTGPICAGCGCPMQTFVNVDGWTCRACSSGDAVEIGLAKAIGKFRASFPGFAAGLDSAFEKHDRFDVENPGATKALEKVVKSGFKALIKRQFSGD